MDKGQAIKVTGQLIMALDTELELLEEHGGQAVLYRRLSRRLEGAQRRLYTLRKVAIVRMAVLSTYGSNRVIHGTVADVQEQVRINGIVRRGAGWV